MKPSRYPAIALMLCAPIPLLLLRARATSGNGIFSGVKYIQRLNTVGGNAPTVACRMEQTGQELRASYTADYLFYGVKR